MYLNKLWPKFEWFYGGEGGGGVKIELRVEMRRDCKVFFCIGQIFKKN